MKQKKNWSYYIFDYNNYVNLKLTIDYSNDYIKVLFICR